MTSSPFLVPMEPAENTKETIPGERRMSRRYPLRFPIEVRTPGGWVPPMVGTTIDMSSQGMAFAAPAEWKPNTPVEVSVNWPVRLDHSCPLKLVVSGEVVRSQSGVTAVRVQRYQFRTRARD